MLALDVYQLQHFELNPMSQKFHLMNDTLKVSVPPFSFTIPSPCGDTPLLNCYSLNKSSLKCHRKNVSELNSIFIIWIQIICDPSHIAIMFNINTLTILVLGQVFAQMNIYKWMMNMWPEFIWRLRKCKAGFAFLLEIKVANIFKTIFYENITSPVNMEFKIWENVTGKWMFCAKSKEGKWKVRVQQCCSDKNNLSRVLKIKWSKINIQQLGSLMSKNNFCSKFS